MSCHSFKFRRITLEWGTSTGGFKHHWQDLIKSMQNASPAVQSQVTTIP